MQFDTLKDLLAASTAEADRLDGEANVLEQALADLNIQVSNLENALVDTRQDLVDADAKMDRLRVRIAELEAQLLPPPPPEPEPQRHVLWGASTAWAPIHHDTHNKEEEARYLEDKIGRKLDITRHYHQTVNGLPETWASDNCKDSIASGRQVMFTFTSAGHSWPEVANGALDSHVRTECEKMQALGMQGFVAFENEPEAEGGKGTPADYRRAADRVLAIIGDYFYTTTALMEWTWRANDRDPEDWIPNNITHLGVHRYFYQLGTCGTSNRISFYNGLKAVHATAEAHGVRLGVWEGGQQEDMGTPDPEFKGNWNRTIPAACEQLPLLDAFTWWHSGGKEGPFPGTCAWERGIRIDSTAKALAGYKEASQAAILGG